MVHNRCASAANQSFFFFATDKTDKNGFSPGNVPREKITSVVVRVGPWLITLFLPLTKQTKMDIVCLSPYWSVANYNLNLLISAFGYLKLTNNPILIPVALR
jgi:hypothetical protein